MWKASACCNPTASGWISLSALFLSLQLVYASEDMSDEGTHMETSEGGIPPPKRPPMTVRECEVPAIDTGTNGLVAQTCYCSNSKGGHSLYDDEDDSYEDEETEFSAMSVVTRKTEVAGDVLLTSDNESFAQPTESIVPTETSPRRGIIAKNGTVENGTPCLLFAKRNGAEGDSIAAGVCHNKQCDNKNLTYYKLPRPVVNPYIYHCKVNTTSINQQLHVAVGCVASCYGRSNKTWNETKLDDGRLCALPKESCNSTYMNRTGVCRNGTCVKADFTRWTHPNGCVDATTRINGKVLAVRCTDFCANKTTQELPDGTPCLLNYKRKVHVPTVADDIVEGICKNGQCIITPPAVPVLMFHIPEEGCDDFVSSVSYTERVEASCSLFCPGRKARTVKSGSLCAQQSKGRWWPRVTKVGQCLEDTCIDKGPEFPARHKQINSESFNCKISDYVTVEAGRLVVVASCQVECGYGVFEPRRDGVKCLLEYSKRSRNDNSADPSATYTVGVCKNGYCTLGKSPMRISAND